MIDLRHAAHALGGEATGRQINCPGPGHSPRDRSLSVHLSATAPDGFICHSHFGDDWRSCRDHVRRRLGLPDWRPGDEQDRRIHPSRVRESDRMAVNRESEQRARTDDDLIRINGAQALWNEAADPRDRRMLGIVHRAAVKLEPISHTLMVGEGIETCMAARQIMAAGAQANI